MDIFFYRYLDVRRGGPEYDENGRGGFAGRMERDRDRNEDVAFSL